MPARPRPGNRPRLIRQGSRALKSRASPAWAGPAREGRRKRRQRGGKRGGPAWAENRRTKGKRPGQPGLFLMGQSPRKSLRALHEINGWAAQGNRRCACAEKQFMGPRPVHRTRSRDGGAAALQRPKKAGFRAPQSLRGLFAAYPEPPAAFHRTFP